MAGNAEHHHAAQSPEEQKEIIELAAAEGHDADIPSNLGALRDSFEKDLPGDFSGNDVDVEKAELSSQLTEDGREQASADENDPNVVFWDGPDDPQNPMNWSAFIRWGSISVISCITFVTPLGSAMFAPAVPELMEEFQSTDELLAGFVVSVYVLGFAFGPLVIAPMSEMYGRLPLYHSCNVLFVIFNIACAVSNSMGLFIFLRFMAGSVGAAPLALGGGTIADLIAPAQRGTAMAVYVMGPCIGPVVGPVIGGFTTEAKGWRWNFWVVAIAAAAATIGGFIFLRETYAPTILTRKAKRLRNETGNEKLRSKLDTGLGAKDLFLYSIVRPTKMLIFSPIVLSLSVYVAIAYAYLYMFFTNITPVFENQYGWPKNLVGLAFIGLGIGQFIGQGFFIYFGNRTVKKHLRKGDFRPEHRLPMMVPGAILLPIGLFWYAWSTDAAAHWILPEIGTVIFGLGLFWTWMPSNTYLVDAFTLHAASAMAANTVLRSVVAAVLPLAGQDMYATLGLGWGTSLLAFISLLLIPIPFWLMKHGESIRVNHPVKL
ncbi:major facilitator superfamily domain-containing protein [Lineolata rhizophorae]|uniref:Major facilitator superfamily domain-containing protein n=1 Tax=Lineolata rhizophorae TaxID=578093 RepID=A0A6A6P0C9_9PEZI|nr:major facilitator superfamily domain-containing protein [Lineolata rhizophorae]